MLDTIIDNLSRLDSLIGYIPTVIHILILVFWTIFIRVSKAKYQVTINWSLFILLVSITAQLLTLFTLSRTFAEYSFILLSIGILQIIFTKNTDNKF